MQTFPNCDFSNFKNDLPNVTIRNSIQLGKQPPWVAYPPSFGSAAFGDGKKINKYGAPSAAVK